MRLVEVYATFQGEGPNTGQPCTFIRFGGCNLRCPGWGEGKLPDGTVVPGCDTVFAVYPEWRDSWLQTDVDGVIDAFDPFQHIERVCLTGGEPLTQRTGELDDLVGRLFHTGHKIDLFTNGSMLIPIWAKKPFVTVVMDYKLPGSGEYGSFCDDNWDRLNNKDAIKFVIKDRDDFEMALAVCDLADLWDDDYAPIPYFGPVWGLEPEILADWVLKEAPTRARLNIQTHKYIWHPEKRGV